MNTYEYKLKDDPGLYTIEADVVCAYNKLSFYVNRSIMGFDSITGSPTTVTRSEHVACFVEDSWEWFKEVGQCQ